ncbi:MAG: NADH-quinone oxidoreductase subunit NuoH, partial [Chloroflexi bacterium]
MTALIIEAIIKSIILIVLLLTGFAYMTWIERKMVARFQVRYGPNRVGPFGLLQPVADGIKLLFKEEVAPAQADKTLFTLAPVITVVPALILLAVVPIGGQVTLFGRPIAFAITDINVGILYVLAVTSISVYGIVLAGWASNSKYPLLGGLRSSAQMISYELAMGLAILGVLLLAGSMSMHEIVRRQMEGGVWYVFLQPVAAIIFILTGLAEVNRAPFDMPEAEQELTAGYHTEYSGMKFALFFMAEYVKMIGVSGLAVTLFFGGWLPPFPNLLRGLWEAIGGFTWLSPLWFTAKVLVLLVVMVWLRATLPRFRYDRLMAFGWKVLLPLALLNVIVTAGVLALLG